jgi:hypothetical protein
MTDDCLRRYGHVAQICRMVALLCLHRDFQEQPHKYPTTIRVALPEDSYLHWDWYLPNPLRSPRVPWRPPNRHSDPESLGIEVIARYSEMHPLALPDTPPEERLVHQEFTRQYEQAIDTDLRLGDADEAVLEYRGRKIRWINGTRALCSVLIVGARNNDAADEMKFISEFLSLVCFETDISLVPVMSIVGPRKTAPTVVQPRKLGDHIYPSGLRLDVGRPLSAERRLALALYRDGISSRSAYYQFLSLYKVLQIRLPGAPVAGWINEHVNDNVPSVIRIRELRDQGIADIAGYLYENWRNAIAHVEREPRVNPDDLQTRARINQDLRIVRDLARTMIESALLD